MAHIHLGLMQTPQQPRFNNKKWCKPPSGYLKVNWDAACNVELGKLGFGAIIRDDNGAVLGTMRGCSILQNC